MAEDDRYDMIEEDFNFLLDESLLPCGPELLYELVASIPLGQSARILDLGCGKGSHSIELAKRIGTFVHGVDPDLDSLEQARQTLAHESFKNERLKDLVRFTAGTAEGIPLEDKSIDLVWCRDVLCLVENLEQAYLECRRSFATVAV